MRYLLMLLLMMLAGCADTGREYYLFVGTYTGEGSEGIYLYRFDTGEGRADSLGAATGVDNPSYLALSQDHRNLYAVNEMADSSAATVSSFSFDPQTGQLQFLNRRSSLGGAPCYVAVDDRSRVVFAGNYLGGSLAIFPRREDGSLGDAGVPIRHSGSGVNEQRQKAPHVHCTYPAPDNEMVLVADLGVDKVFTYRYDGSEGVLQQTPVSVYETEPGAGPRHLTFHPNGRFAYLVNELNGTVTAFQYDAGQLNPIGTHSTLPEGYTGAISGADIHVSPDGKHLYVSNREDLNNIVIYAIDREEGSLTRTGMVESGGVHPRNFTLDPSGKYLLAANRHTDNIVIFRRNSETGALTPTGREIEVSQPVFLQMIPVP